MKKIRNSGKCLQCGNDTNIILENKKFVCQKCLDNLGQQQKYMYKILKDSLQDKDFKLYLNQVIAILEMMEKCDCTKTIHCINALKSFVITYDLKNNNVDEEIVEKIQKTLDDMQ